MTDTTEATDAPKPEPARPEPISEGSLAYDERLHRTGDVIQILGELVALRPNPPVSGYFPWNAALSDLRMATPEERLNAANETARTAARLRGMIQ